MSPESDRKISVIIPLGPTDEEDKKIKTTKTPKPLLTLGNGAVLLWHTLSQVSTIADQIEKIFLIVREGESRAEEIKNSVAEYDEQHTPAWKNKIDIQSGNNIVGKISGLALETPYFMFHNPDIVLPVSKARSFYENLIETHFLCADDGHVVTFVTSQVKFCRGACTLKQLGLFDDRHGLTEKGMRSHGMDSSVIPANVAISMFNAPFTEFLAGITSNLFYEEVVKILRREKLKWMEYCYEDLWYHADDEQTIANYKHKAINK